MLLVCEVMERPYKDVEDIKAQWFQCFREVSEQDPTIIFEEIMKDDYYSSGDYILDTDTNRFYEANDFYHMIIDGVSN